MSLALEQNNVAKKIVALFVEILLQIEFSTLSLNNLELPCERPDISSDENLSITPDETSYLPGTTIAYNCQQGYQLIGNHSATCKDGCFQPPDIPNCQG